MIKLFRRIWLLLRPDEFQHVLQRIEELARRMEQLHEQRDFAGALSAVEESIPLLELIWATNDLLRARLNAGYLCEQVHQWRRALGYYRKTMWSLRFVGDKRRLAQAHAGIGRVLLNVDEFDRASKELERARKLLKETGDQEGLPLVLERLATAYRHLDLYAEQRERATECLQACRDPDRKDLLARAYHLLGQAETKLKNEDAAARALEQAADLYRSLGDEETLIAVLRDLAEAHSNSEHYADALEALSQALQIARDRKDGISECQLLVQIAVVETEAKHYTNAKLHLQQAKEISLNFPAGERLQAEAAILYNFAQWHYRQGEFEAAQRLADQSSKAYEALRNYPGAVAALDLRNTATRESRRQ